MISKIVTIKTKKMKIKKIGITPIKALGIKPIEGVKAPSLKNPHGTYQTKTKENFNFNDNTVHFFRSKAQCDGRYGKENISIEEKTKGQEINPEYYGQFGFDLYNKQVCPKRSFIYYYDKDGKSLKDQSGDEYDGYVVPYLSIWPPKTDEKKSSVTLYVKASDGSKIPELLKYECLEWNNNNKSFSTPTKKLSIKMLNTENVSGRDYYKIYIQCNESFENDISIIAKYENKPVGRIIVKANAITYETIIQPVFVSFGDTASTTIEEKNHGKFVNELADYFNNYSFNQAYIKCKLANKTHSIVFLENDFTNGDVVKLKDKKLFVNYTEKNQDNAKEYNRLVEKGYSSHYNNNIIIIKDNLKKMDAAIKLIIEGFKNGFKNYGTKSNLKKAKEFHKEKYAKNAWNLVKYIYMKTLI